MARFIIKNVFLSGNENERMNKIKGIIIDQINRNLW